MNASTVKQPAIIRIWRGRTPRGSFRRWMASTVKTASIPPAAPSR